MLRRFAWLMVGCLLCGTATMHAQEADPAPAKAEPAAAAPVNPAAPGRPFRQDRERDSRAG